MENVLVNINDLTTEDLLCLRDHIEATWLPACYTAREKRDMAIATINALIARRALWRDTVTPSAN